MPVGPSTHAIGTHAIYSPLQQYLNCVVVSILAFHVQFPHGATICHISFFFLLILLGSQNLPHPQLRGELTYYCRSLHFTSARAQMLSYRDYKRDYKEFINGSSGHFWRHQAL